jgi:hypothetical protein
MYVFQGTINNVIYLNIIEKNNNTHIIIVIILLLKELEATINPD